MAHNPIPAIAIVMGTRLMIALIAGATADFNDVPTCDSVADIFTGCSGALGFLSGLFLGTIPGAPLQVNIISFLLQVSVFWAIITWARGN